jgi:hypothetical protein
VLRAKYGTAALLDGASLVWFAGIDAADRLAHGSAPGLSGETEAYLREKFSARAPIALWSMGLEATVPHRAARPLGLDGRDGGGCGRRPEADARHVG